MSKEDNRRIINALRFDEPDFEMEHPIIKEGGEGVQKIWKFKNGYGANVVRFALGLRGKIGEKIGSHGVERGLWEMAIIKFELDDDTEHGKPHFRLCYDTKITSDVISNLTEQEVVEILNKIQNLKPK